MKIKMEKELESKGIDVESELTDLLQSELEKARIEQFRSLIEKTGNQENIDKFNNAFTKNRLYRVKK